MEIKFIKKVHLANDIYEFTFTKPDGYVYDPGDYAELGLDYDKLGGKRWFSIASSPMEKTINFITRIPKEKTSYKKALSEIEPSMIAQLSPAIGTFNLPKTANSTLLFIAVGVGITPYISMLKHIYKNKLAYKINLLYLAQNHSDFIYKDLYIKIPNLNTKYRISKYSSSQEEISFAIISSNYTLSNINKIYLAGAQHIIERLYGEFIVNGIERNRLALDYYTGYRDI